MSEQQRLAIHRIGPLARTKRFIVAREYEYPCPTCSGKGWYAKNDDNQDIGLDEQEMEMCVACMGSGYYRQEADLAEALKFYGVTTNE